MYTFICQCLGATDKGMLLDTVPPKIINLFSESGGDKTVANAVQAYQ